MKENTCLVVCFMYAVCISPLDVDPAYAKNQAPKLLTAPRTLAPSCVDAATRLGTGRHAPAPLRLHDVTHNPRVCQYVSFACQVRQRKRAERRAAREDDHDSKNDDGEGSVGHPPAPGKGDGTEPPAGTAATAADEGKIVTARGDNGEGGVGVIGEEELTKHTPEVRTAIYREMAEQKKEKEDRQRENLPKDRDFELEQVVKAWRGGSFVRASATRVSRLSRCAKNSGRLIFLPPLKMQRQTRPAPWPKESWGSISVLPLAV